MLDYAYTAGLNYDILTYHKSNPIPACNNKYLSDTEYCVFMRGRGVALHGNYESKFTYYCGNIQEREFDHPTIKPIPLIERLIFNSSVEGQTVLDPFIGSGTTAVAAKNLGRRCIGIELEEKYLEIAVRRLAQGVFDFSGGAK